MNGRVLLLTLALGLIFSLVVTGTAFAQSKAACASCGDADHDGAIDITDGVFYIQYFFGGGTVIDTCGEIDGCGGVAAPDLILFSRYVRYWTGPPFECGNPIACPTETGGEIRIDCWPIERYPGNDSIAVPIRITTIPGVVGLNIVLGYLNDNVEVTSVSTAGSQVAVMSLWPEFYPETNQVVLVAVLDGLNPPVFSNALLCKLNVRILNGDPSQLIDYDTSYVAPFGSTVLVTNQKPYYTPVLTHNQCCTACGDANMDGTFDISDAVFALQCIVARCDGAPGSSDCNYQGGYGDANGDQAYDISDVVYLIQYIFAGGPAPHCYGM